MVQLVAMEEWAFENYLCELVKNYAADHVKGGRWSEEEAMGKAWKEVRSLVPEGVKSPGHDFYTIYDPDVQGSVGHIWIARQSEGPLTYAFIYDFGIDEAYRRRGYGEAALRAAEEKVREMGLSRISLHVFGHNAAAIRLYDRVGYLTTNVLMAKELGK